MINKPAYSIDHHYVTSYEELVNAYSEACALIKGRILQYRKGKFRYAYDGFRLWTAFTTNMDAVVKRAVDDIQPYDKRSLHGGDPNHLYVTPRWDLRQFFEEDLHAFVTGLAGNYDGTGSSHITPPIFNIITDLIGAEQWRKPADCPLPYFELKYPEFVMEIIYMPPGEGSV